MWVENYQERACQAAQGLWLEEESVLYLILRPVHPQGETQSILAGVWSSPAGPSPTQPVNVQITLQSGEEQAFGWRNGETEGGA